MSTARRDVQSFLGRKNFKGLYTQNPLARTPAYAKFDRSKIYATSYPVRAKHRQGKRLTNWSEVFSGDNAVASRQPFQHNKFTRSNELVGETLRQAILADHANGETTQRLSFKYGISVQRIDAILRLSQVRADMEKSGSISREMRKMGKHLSGFFNEIKTEENGVPLRKVDNLTEIPLVRETRTQRFISIAESEPFGPVDAAAVLGIEPASEKLDKLTRVVEEQEQTNVKSHTNSFFAPQHEGDRVIYRFTDAKVGKVGYRYGAARDDRKHARKVRFLPNGRMTYPLPVHS